MKCKLESTMMATALLMSGAVAFGQEISTGLPLTSVGDQLKWAVSDQNLQLTVPVSGQVRLELYSPRLDPQDYRSDTYYGDEQYSAAQPVATTFTLLRADGSEVLRRSFTPGEHGWEVLLDQNLPAGNYQLRAETAGNAKNTFSVRLAGVSAALSAERLAVNVHSSQWAPVLSVATDGAGYVLKMYDGDGPQELEARLRDASGKVYPLTVSGDLAASDLPVPAAAGHYTVELRQPATAKQYSNTVAFSLSRSGVATPITISKVDQTGLLRVSAELLLPGGIAPTSADVLVGNNPLHVDSRLEKTVVAGSYPVTAAQVPGADVKLSGPTVNVPKGGSGDVRVQVSPQVALSLTTDKTEVCVGDTVTLTARASTAFAGDLPMSLGLDAPALHFGGEPALNGVLNAARPGELRLSATATEPGPLTVRAKLAPWSQEQTLTLNVRPDVTRVQLSREPLGSADTGSEVVVRLKLTNTASEAVPFILTDTAAAGLEPLDGTTFTGRLAAGETRELSYRARVVAENAADIALKASLQAEGCAATQVTQGTLSVTQPVPAQAPELVRRSTVNLPFDAPAQARGVTVAHSVPAGATYASGSSKLNGESVADPLRGPSGTLYWNLPVAASSGPTQSGNLTYDLNHAAPLGELPRPTLSVSYGGNRQEVLQGKLDAADLAAARPLSTAKAELSENGGAIKLPLQGTVVRIRDRISVTVEAPQGEIPTLTVNGKAVSPDLIGTNTQDSTTGLQRLTFVGVPVQSGPNVIRFMGQEITVSRVGATSRVEVTPLDLLADGSSPIRLKIRTLDAFGQPTDQTSLTVRSNLEPLTADASPGEAGYQVRIVDGEGVLELQPQSSPTTLKLDVLSGQKVESYTYDVRPDGSRVGVGMFSATAGLGSNFNVQKDLSWQARAYYEGPLAGGKLYVAADKDKLPTNENTLVRSPVYGDASSETVPLQGLDPVALTYDHPLFRADYRRNSLPIDVLPVGEQLTALTAYAKTNPRLSGFVAAVPDDRVSNLPVTPEGTRLLHLPDSGISEGSETLVLVTLEHGTGKLLSTVNLTRNVDYVLDLKTGVVTLTRALDRVDLNLNEQRVYASYRLANPLGKRRLAFGAQLKKTGQNYSVGVAAVSLDQTVTYGARATYDNGTTRADGLLAYSGGVQASASVSSAPNERQTFGAKLRYQQPGYHGLGRFGDGLSVSGNTELRLSDRLSLIGDAEYHNVPTGSASADPLVGLTAPDTATGGSVSARADYKFSPFSVGLGARYAFGDVYGLGAVGSVGYHQGRTNVDIVHTQPLSGNLKATTDVSAKFGVGRNVNLGFTDKITWGVGQAAALTLDTMIGNVNYAVGYELPTAGGAGNRARFGVSTSLPLSKRTALGLRGSALYNVATASAELGTGADLNYKSDTVSASVGTDLSSNERGFGVVVRGGMTGSVNDRLTLTADGLVEYGQGKNGQRLSLGYAYRGNTLASLGYVRYQNGTLAGNAPELSTGISAEYHRTNWALRGGLDTRTLLLDKASYTWQAYAGATAYLNDDFGVGAWGRAIGQPGSSYSAYGYGLEGSVRALPGMWLSAGYNFKGFDGLSSANTYTKQGAYLRLDLTVDETLSRKK